MARRVSEVQFHPCEAVARPTGAVSPGRGPMRSRNHQGGVRPCRPPCRSDPADGLRCSLRRRSSALRPTGPPRHFSEDRLWPGRGAPHRCPANCEKPRRNPLKGRENVARFRSSKDVKTSDQSSGRLESRRLVNTFWPLGGHNGIRKTRSYPARAAGWRATPPSGLRPPNATRRSRRISRPSQSR